MDMKKSIVYSQVLHSSHQYYNIFEDISQSFGYDVVLVDSGEQAFHYLKEVTKGAFFCDDILFDDRLRKKFDDLPGNSNRLSVIVLTTDNLGMIQYDRKIDHFLILSLPAALFEQSVFSVYKYLWMKEKLFNVSGIANPEFSKKLLSDAAHAINNILTGMQGYAELAQLNPDDEKLIQDSFQVVLDSAYRVRHEVKNLRAFIRVENPIIEPVNFRDVLRESADLLKKQIHAKDILLDEKVEKGSLVNGDYDQLVQVFFNLLNDVVHNIAETGSIHMNLSYKDKTAVVSIESNGYSLSDRDYSSLERIFAFDEPVLKSDSKEGKIENRNILSICNRIVHNHKGTILVERRDPSTIVYTVRIPVLKEPFEVSDADETVMKQAYEYIDNLDMEILIVDDEEYVRNTIYYFFDKKGCRVTLAEDGEFGFNIAEEKPFDLIFMDYLMPKMGGVEAARKIIEHNKEVKIVFITGRESLDEEELYKSGIYACIKKPFEMSDLYDIAKKVALQKGIVD